MPSMSMPLVAMCRSAAHLFHRHHATFQLLAAYVLELYGRVRDLKMFAQNVIELQQNASALRGRDIVDGHVAGERAGV